MANRVRYRPRNTILLRASQRAPVLIAYYTPTSIRVRWRKNCCLPTLDLIHYKHYAAHAYHVEVEDEDTTFGTERLRFNIIGATKPFRCRSSTPTRCVKALQHVLCLRPARTSEHLLFMLVRHPNCFHELFAFANLKGE